MSEWFEALLASCVPDLDVEFFLTSRSFKNVLHVVYSECSLAIVVECLSVVHFDNVCLSHSRITEDQHVKFIITHLIK